MIADAFLERLTQVVVMMALPEDVCSIRQSTLTARMVAQIGADKAGSEKPIRRTNAARKYATKRSAASSIQ